MVWFAYRKAKRLSLGAAQFGFAGDGSLGVVVDRCAGHNNTRQILSTPVGGNVLNLGIRLGQPPLRIAPGTTSLIKNPLQNQVLSDLSQNDEGA